MLLLTMQSIQLVLSLQRVTGYSFLSAFSPLSSLIWYFLVLAALKEHKANLYLHLFRKQISNWTINASSISSWHEGSEKILAPGDRLCGTTCMQLSLSTQGEAILGRTFSIHSHFFIQSINSLSFSGSNYPFPLPSQWCVGSHLFPVERKTGCYLTLLLG